MLKTDQNESLLLDGVARGDRQSLNDLIACYEGWAYHKARECPFYGVDKDDIISYALEAVWEAAISHRACKNFQLRAIAWLNLRNKLIDHIRRKTFETQFVRENIAFHEICSSKVVFPSSLSDDDGRRERCVECGTTGGRLGPSCKRPDRIKGLCLDCYDRIRIRKKRLKQMACQKV